MALINKLNAIGDAVRVKSGKTDKFTLDQIAQEIINLPEGPTVIVESVKNYGTVTPTTSSQAINITPSAGYDAMSQATLTVDAYPEPIYDTPSIDISSGGLITASANGKSNTKQLTTKAATTIAPSSRSQTAISSGTYATGNITVSAVPTESVSDVTPSSSSQTISATSGQYFTSLTVKAVPTETKSAVTPTKSSQTINATSGKYMTSLTVNAIPSDYIIPSGSQTLTENKTYDVSSLAQVIVNVAGGSLPSGISKLAFGTDTIKSDFTTTRRTVTHNLGVTPDMVLYWHNGNIATTYSMLWALRSTQMGYRSSAYNSFMCYHGNSTTTASLTNSNSTTYGVSNLSSSTFQLASSSSSYYWRAGTYNWIAIKFG